MTARILVVDDEPDLELLISQRFRRQIRDGSFSFAFAEDGVSALAALDGDPTIDMVLSDINMPRMDGLTLLARLQERGVRCRHSPCCWGRTAAMGWSVFI